MKVLILEDNLKALNILTEAFKELEPEIGRFDVTCFSEATIAEDFLKEVDSERFDLVLLDKLSRDGKTFHEVVLGPPSLKLRQDKKRINPEKIIAISNTNSYNQEAIDQGVLRAVKKDYFDLNRFKAKIKEEVKKYFK